MNWKELNAKLPSLSEDDVLLMMREEQKLGKRPTYIKRLHQRYTALRAQRERRELDAPVAPSQGVFQ